MRTIAIVFLFTLSITGYSQEKINYFNGNFDSALEKAKKSNKNIFLITRSKSCHVFDVFKENITQDSETIDLLNKEFIVFEFDMDSANEKETKRLKKYYHSWRGFPQIYFIDKNEKLISDIIYSLNYTHEENLNLWKDYKQIESNWKIIKRNKRNITNLENLKRFLFFRQIKYSPYELMQTQNVIEKYFKSIDKQSYSNKENWVLFEKYITHASNPKLFDFVAQNKKDFQDKNGVDNISNYLSINYSEMVSWKTKEDRLKAINQYPFNTISEAKKALEDYKEIESTFKFEKQE